MVKDLRKGMPLNIFFVPVYDGNGNKVDIEMFFNGGDYPDIALAKKVFELSKELYEDAVSLGDEKIVAINKEIAKERTREMEEEMNRPREKRGYLSYEGYVYVLKSGEFYKIGHTVDMDVRIKSYRAENPHGIKVIFKRKVKDCIATEKLLLDTFKDKKINRGKEWFKLESGDIKKLRFLVQ